jgi:hypothetical protein
VKKVLGDFIYSGPSDREEKVATRALVRRGGKSPMPVCGKKVGNGGATCKLHEAHGGACWF